MSSEATERVRERFRAKARAFDHLYDETSWLQRQIRPALHRRTELALELVERHESPRVLDVGCGSGRVGEVALERGASDYVGIDLSDEMLTLARERLVRFASRVHLVEGDFLTAQLEGRFDVVLALGFFDYIRDPAPFARRMRELCSGSVGASFPTWTWHKGPVRKLRYEVIGNCPIFDYTADRVVALFRSAGFDDVLVTLMSASGLFAEATVREGA